MSELKIQELNKIYQDAEEADREIFAEMRSNVLLVAGEHYSKRGSSDLSTRTTAEKTERAKLRLVKNLTHKVKRRYVTAILSHAPGVTAVPKNEKEVQDIKAAELNKSVMEDIKQKLKVREKNRLYASDLIGVGEVCVKVFWDPMAGDFKGYENQVAEDGSPVLDEMGQPVADQSKPLFTGGFVWERVFGYNLLRDAGISDMRETQGKPWIIRKMVPIKVLERRYAGDADKLKMIQPSRADEFVVFDSNKASYERKKDQCMVREYYWPKCETYPEGYFAITTEYGVLEEGPLPFGIFPIAWNGCDEFQGSPRRRSILKVVRPYQAEINRASSQQAWHQITVGDDKILYQKGTKLEQGSLLPGVRGVSYQGMTPVVLPGRDGGQFQPYVQSQIQEMFMAADMDEMNEEKPAQMDPYTMLQRSIEDQLKYADYGQNFEDFQIDLWTITLELAKKYLPDDALIPAIGRHEYINISEFRNSSPLNTQIKLMPQAETADQKLGKQLALNHILQYAGQNLSKEEMAIVARAMPFANAEEAFSEFLTEYDNIKNDILALDRGEFPMPHPNDDHVYVIKKLTNRMKQADFKFLDPKIQENYEKKRAMHEQLEAENQRKLLAAKSQLIPTGGAMIACDMYVPDKEDPTKAPKRVRIPYQSLEWLVQTLDSQGQSLDKLQSLHEGVVAEIAGIMQQQQQGLPPGGQVIDATSQQMTGAM